MPHLVPGSRLEDLELIRLLDDQSPHGRWLAATASGDHAIVSVVEQADQDTIVRLKSRIESVNGLRHPSLQNLVRLLNQDGCVFIVQTIPSGTQPMINSPVSLESILAAAIRVAETLQYAHDQQVVHGNLQAENIVNDTESQLKLTAFAIDPDDNYPPADDFAAFGGVLNQWLQYLRHNEQITAADQDRQMVPPRLRNLLAQMTSTDPDLQPTSMAEVRDELDDIRLQWRRIQREGIPPAWVDDAAAIPDVRTAAQNQQRPVSPGRWGLISIIVVIVLLISWLIWLPTQVPQQPITNPMVIDSSTTDASAEPAAPEPLTEAQLEALLEQRKNAQAILDEFIELRLELEERQVELWAEKSFLSAVTIKETGDQPFRNQQFEEATVQYQAAVDQLTELEQQSVRELEESIAAGFGALDRGDSVVALESFGLALAIDPEHSKALQGQQRAESLDQVLGLISQARALEEQAAWINARDVYQQARQLDPETNGLEEAIQRLSGIIEDNAFKNAMSDGLAALDRGALNDAAAAFRRAQQLRPGSSGPAEGLQELNRRQREAGLQQQLDQARQLEAAERWAEAQAAWEDMLAKDSTLRYAIEGSTRSRQRANLDAALQAMLDDPPSWWHEKGRSQAQSLLAEARSTSNSSPRLTRQITALADLLSQAQRQIPVTLVSDSQCEVVIYKVGRLGRFQTTELMLHPGRYTVVGTREGFRDVRLEIMVPPNPLPEPFTVTCNDRIADVL